MCNSALRSDLCHLDWTAGSFLVPVIGVCVGRRQGWGWGRGRRRIRHVAQAGLSALTHNSYSNPVAFSNLCWRVYSSLVEHVKFKTISWHFSHQLGLHIAWKIWWQRPPRASLVAPMVKNLPAMRETWVCSLGWEDPLEEGMATQSSTLAWRSPMDRGAWWAAVHRVTRNQTWLSS